MTNSAQEAAAERLRQAFEMSEFGIRLYRQRVHREHPELDESQLDAAVAAWLLLPAVPESDRAWIAAALDDRLALDRLGEAVADYESEHGELTEADVAGALQRTEWKPRIES